MKNKLTKIQNIIFKTTFTKSQNSFLDEYIEKSLAPYPFWFRWYFKTKIFIETVYHYYFLSKIQKNKKFKEYVKWVNNQPNETLKLVIASILRDKTK